MTQTQDASTPQGAGDAASLAGRADPDDFAALYERYFDSLYDFTLRTVRDRDLAADIVQSTFTKAWESLQKHGSPDNEKAWLYAIARNTAIDELRRQKHVAGRREKDETDEDEPPEFTAIETSRESDPETVLADKELAALVWSAASALSPKEYTLLDLHVRRGLDADELAASLGLRKGNVYTMLSRLRDSLEASVGAMLLIRRGRSDCPELDALIVSLGVSELSADTRGAVDRHLKSCDRCQESRRRFVSPLEIFAGLAPAGALPGVKASVWQGVSEAMSAPPAPPAGPAQLFLTLPAALRLLLLGFVAAVLGVIGVFAMAGSADEAPLALLVDDPNDIRSISHVPNQRSSNNVIEFVWSRQEGVAAYSILWSHGPTDLPAAEPNLAGDATGAASPPLADGTWYFHLRTQGKNGVWTNTYHSEGFAIDTTTPTPTPTMEPTATATSTPTAPPPPTSTRPPMPAATAPPAATSTPVAPPAPAPTLAPPPTLVPPPTNTTVPPLSPSPSTTPVGGGGNGGGGGGPGR